MLYLINLGSNLGNKRLNLSRAMRGVAEAFGPFELSHTVESAPQGFKSDHSFLNVGMAFNSDLEPEEVLARLQEIERSISPASHRRADGSYADRMIDIDIVAADDLCYDSHHLHIPHPRLAERRFFLEPLDELAPGWRHPHSGKTAREMLMELRDGSSRSERKHPSYID